MEMCPGRQTRIPLTPKTMNSMEILLLKATEIDTKIANIRDFSSPNNYFLTNGVVENLNDLEIETLSVKDLREEFEKSFDSLQIQVEALVEVLATMGFKRTRLEKLPKNSKSGKHQKVKRISSYSDSMVEEQVYAKVDQDEEDLNLQEMPSDSNTLDDELKLPESPTFQLSTLSLQLLADKQPPSQERESLDSLTPPVATLAETRVSDSLFSALIKAATEKEYGMLPVYVTNQVTIGYLNDVVAEINDLLTDKR